MDVSLKDKLSEDLKTAMRSRDAVKVSTLRLLFSAINNAEIAKQAKLADTDIFVIIGKEIKQRQESIDAFKAGNRQDLVDKEQAEMVVLQAYMPKQMSNDEIVEVAKRIVAEVGAHGPTDKSKVMPKIIAELKGKADGREINNVVTELLK